MGTESQRSGWWQIDALDFNTNSSLCTQGAEQGAGNTKVTCARHRPPCWRRFWWQERSVLSRDLRERISTTYRSASKDHMHTGGSLSASPRSPSSENVDQDGRQT